MQRWLPSGSQHWAIAYTSMEHSVSRRYVRDGLMVEESRWLKLALFKALRWIFAQCFYTPPANILIETPMEMAVCSVPSLARDGERWTGKSYNLCWLASHSQTATIISQTFYRLSRDRRLNQDCWRPNSAIEHCLILLNRFPEVLAMSSLVEPLQRSSHAETA